MCYHIIEQHPCGHKTQDLIPCERLSTNNDNDTTTCTAPPEQTQDQIKDSPHDCRKCKDRKAEDEAFEADLRRIAEDPALAPMPKTATKRSEGGGGFGVFKERTRWVRCKHISHPILLDLERESASDPEWLEREEPGSCHACCEANPRLLAAMKESGELAQEDPWGAMDAAPEVAAGGSKSRLPPVHPAFGDDDGEEDGRSPSPDQLPVLIKGKGKGRASKPEETYASRYGAAASDSEGESAARSGRGDSDNDDDEEEVYPPGKGKNSKPPKYDFHGSGDDGDDDEDDEGHHAARGRKLTRRSTEGSISSRASSQYSVEEEKDGDVPHWGSKPPPGSPPPRNPARARRNSMDAPDSDDDMDEEPIEVSPRERAKYGIPPNLPMTETKLKVWKESQSKEENMMSGERAGSG